MRMRQILCKWVKQHLLLLVISISSATALWIIFKGYRSLGVIGQILAEESAGPAVVANLVSFLGLGSLFITSLFKPSADEMAKYLNELKESIEKDNLQKFQDARTNYTVKANLLKQATLLRIPFVGMLIIIGFYWIALGVAKIHAKASLGQAILSVQWVNGAVIVLGIILIITFSKFFLYVFTSPVELRDLQSWADISFLLTEKQKVHLIELISKKGITLIVNSPTEVSVKWPDQLDFGGKLYQLSLKEEETDFLENEEKLIKEKKVFSTSLTENKHSFAIILEGRERILLCTEYVHSDVSEARFLPYWDTNFSQRIKQGWERELEKRFI